jgi:hypothetical protein
MGTILSLASRFVLTTPPRDRSWSLRCSSVNNMLAHCVLDAKPLAGKRRFDISVTAGCTMEDRW